MSAVEQFKLRERPKQTAETIDLSVFEEPMGQGLEEDKQLLCSVIREGSLDDLLTLQRRLDDKAESETIRSYYDGVVKFEVRAKLMEKLYEHCINAQHDAFGLIVKEQSGAVVALGQLFRNQGPSDTWDIGLLVSHDYQHSSQNKEDERAHVGTELLDRLMMYVKLRNIQRIETVSHNPHAIHLLEKRYGFKPIRFDGSARTEVWEAEENREVA